MNIYKIYLELRKKYKKLNKYWKLWCKRKKSSHEREKIAIGAILAQRTNWKNVEIVLNNLEEKKILSIRKIYQIGKNNLSDLEELIKPSGFYRQKAKYLFGFCKFIIENYKTFKNFLKQDIDKARKQLLNLEGIGKETADSILLYACDKPVFVIDEYTRRLTKKYHLANNFSYDFLQAFFESQLPKNPKIYQDFHAMIVLEGQKKIQR
ncbi:hypothetical protein J7K03_00465 [bacterium]|nr:hypothetical protein [bacterium]